MYAHNPLEELHTGNGRAKIVTEVALQYRFPATNDRAFRNGGSNHDWSEPIFACGGKGLGKGGAVFTDARKSADQSGHSLVQWQCPDISATPAA